MYLPRHKPAAFIEDQCFGIIHNRPTGFRDQTIFKLRLACEPIQGARCAFEVASFAGSIAVPPGHLAVLELDAQVLRRESRTSDFINEMEIIRFNLYDFISDLLLEFGTGWSRYQKTCDGRSSKILSLLYSIRMIRSVNTVKRTFGAVTIAALVGNGLERRNRRKRHRDSSIFMAGDCQLAIPSVTKLHKNAKTLPRLGA